MDVGSVGRDGRLAARFVRQLGLSVWCAVASQLRRARTRTQHLVPSVVVVLGTSIWWPVVFMLTLRTRWSRCPSSGPGGQLRVTRLGLRTVLADEADNVRLCAVIPRCERELAELGDATPPLGTRGRRTGCRKPSQTESLQSRCRTVLRCRRRMQRGQGFRLSTQRRPSFFTTRPGPARCPRPTRARLPPGLRQ